MWCVMILAHRRGALLNASVQGHPSSVLEACPVPEKKNPVGTRTAELMRVGKGNVLGNYHVR